MRSLGYKCIENRIKAIREGEEVPNDILSQILRISSTYFDKYVCGWGDELGLEFFISYAPVAVDNDDFDIEELIDHFVTFYVGGKHTVM